MVDSFVDYLKTKCPNDHEYTLEVEKPGIVGDKLPDEKALTCPACGKIWRVNIGGRLLRMR